MFIKEVELNNFRIYKGNKTISLLPESDKNIIIVSGKNGYGKTTFLMALVWCLYGKQMEKVDELYEKEIRDKGNYTKYISNSLNYRAKEEGETTFSVSITFSDVKIPDIKCKEVRITRKYDIVTSASDFLEVLIDGYHNQIIDDLTKENQKGEEIFIREFILPIEIAKFFFFDAEKIVSLAEVNSNVQRKHLSKAYSEVLGIQKYEDLKANLEEKQDEYRKHSAKPEEKEELNNLKNKIDNAQIKIEKFEIEIEDLRSERNSKIKEQEDIQRKLIREGEKMTLEELNAMKNEETKLEKKKDSLQDSLKELFDYIPFGLAGETVLNVSEQLLYEKIVIEQKYKLDDVNAKTSQILLDVEKERVKTKLVFKPETRNFYEEQIKILIKKHFFSDVVEVPETFKPLHDFSINEANEFEQLINTLKHSFKEKFSKLTTDYSYIRNQLESITRKIRDAEKSAEDDYIKELREKKYKADNRIISINNEIDSLNQKIGEINNEVKTFRQKQEVLRKKIDDTIEYSAKEKKTKELISKLQNFISKFKAQKKQSLEKKILNYLNLLLHKKGFISKVVVDISVTSDDIDIILYNKSENIIDKGTLSMGERQMYASALLSSLVAESDIEFPVFIDSPMQKFDEDHANNIIKHFYPNVSEQVVIFPLINKELTEKEFSQLKSNICKAYLINNLDTGNSEFISTTSRDFFKTYNELYHAN